MRTALFEGLTILAVQFSLDTAPFLGKTRVQRGVDLRGIDLDAPFLRQGLLQLHPELFLQLLLNLLPVFFIAAGQLRQLGAQGSRLPGSAVQGQKAGQGALHPLFAALVPGQKEVV